jgi:hypothetical protein
MAMGGIAKKTPIVKRAVQDLRRAAPQALIGGMPV